MRLTGSGAEVWWGYYLAARLGPFTIERDAAGGTLTAELEPDDRNEFRLTQSPLELVIPVRLPPGSLRTTPPDPWRWPLVDVKVTGSTLTARVTS